MPKGGSKEIIDYELTRCACYLIVQNGDPRKEVIALGQTQNNICIKTLLKAVEKICGFLF